MSSTRPRAGTAVVALPLTRATAYQRSIAQTWTSSTQQVEARANDRCLASHAARAGRAIYEWIVENIFRDPDVNGCGLGDIRWMLESGSLGGKCADAARFAM